VRGYLDRYRVTPPGGVTQDVLCASLSDRPSPGDPCAALGGTFAGRVATLVRVDAEPMAGAGPDARIDLCTATVMLVARNTYLNPVDRERVVVAPC
jgi:hypothetical protein